MANNNIESVLNRLPLLDGSGRRRFVVGFIVTFGLGFIFKDEIELINGVDWELFTDHPSLFLVAVFLIFTVGSTIDLLGDIFLLRVAAGVIWASGFPIREARRFKTDDFCNHHIARVCMKINFSRITIAFMAGCCLFTNGTRPDWKAFLHTRYNLFSKHGRKEIFY